jgi:hypothetical protein
MEIALALYEARIGLEPADTAVDASVHKAPAGGEGTGKSPVDRGKLGWKWSLATDANGIPLGLVAGPANRHDMVLFPTPSRSSTIRDCSRRSIACTSIAATTTASCANR